MESGVSSANLKLCLTHITIFWVGLIYLLYIKLKEMLKVEKPMRYHLNACSYF